MAPDSGPRQTPWLHHHTNRHPARGTAHGSGPAGGEPTRAAGQVPVYYAAREPREISRALSHAGWGSGRLSRRDLRQGREVGCRPRPDRP